MDLFSILTLIGGLALFLYGMNAMGDGLAKVSGGKLEKILENLTSNPIKAVLLGAGVTAVIQSSSATTVMVVGFVNSGTSARGFTAELIISIPYIRIAKPIKIVPISFFFESLINRMKITPMIASTGENDVGLNI